MKSILRAIPVLLLALLFIFLLPLGNYANAAIQDGPYGIYHVGDVEAFNEIIEKHNLNPQYKTFETWKPYQAMPDGWDNENYVRWHKDENGVNRLYFLELHGFGWDLSGDLDLTKFEKLVTFRADSSLNSINASNMKNLKNLYLISTVYSENNLSNLNVQGSENLNSISCAGQKLKTLDLRGLKNLGYLDCHNNELTELKLAGCNSLQHLECYGNKLQNLNYNLPELRNLDCRNNKLTTLNLTASKQLKNLDCSENQLISLNISGLKDLEILRCWDNKISSLNISGMEKLETLSCTSNNLSGALDLSKYKKLSSIGISDNNFTELKLPAPDIVKYLYCSNNQLTELPDVANRWELQTLACGGNKINYLDLRGLPWLWRLECNDNGLEALNVENSSHLRWLDCSGNRLTELDLSENYRLIELDCSRNNITKVILNEKAPYTYINVSYNNMEDYSNILGRSLLWDKPLLSKYYFTPQKKNLITIPGNTNIIIPQKPGGSIPITIPQTPEGNIPAMPSKSILIDIPGGLLGDSGLLLNDTYLAYLKLRNSALGIKDIILTFNTMGGSKIESVSGPQGTLIDLFEYSPTHSSYLFDGWYEDAGYTNEIYYIKLDKNTTIYAKWDTSMAGPTSFYESASEWAIPELEKAYAAGLVPEILRGLDMKKSISREEFAELAVQLYETATGKTILVTGANPFKDTANQQILKAYQVGITDGVSETAFSPNTLITREQCATMLYRAIKAIAPKADYSITGIPNFPDQAHISSWAAEGTKYMSKLGIILGDTKGYFMPKPLNTAHTASGYGMAAREAAVLMAIRTFEKIK